MRIDWNNIDTVLLDMDGTLIDRRRETEFWETVVPKAYAAKNKLSLEAAKNIVFPKFKEKQGNVDWSSIDHWEKALDMDLWRLRHETVSMMKLHPHTLRFLKFLKKMKKRIYLVTGASGGDADMKLKMTGIRDYFDGVYNQHDIGYAKVEKIFWKKLNEKINFDKNRTLLADDGESVINAAKAFGIKYIILKLKHSSNQPPSRRADVICVHHFDDVLK